MPRLTLNERLTRTLAQHFFVWISPPDRKPLASATELDRAVLSSRTAMAAPPTMEPDLGWSIKVAQEEFDHLRRLVPTLTQPVTELVSRRPPREFVEAAERYVSRLKAKQPESSTKNWPTRLQPFLNSLEQPALSAFARLAKDGADAYWMAALVAREKESPTDVWTKGMRHRLFPFGLTLPDSKRPVPSREALQLARREAKKLARRLRTLADEYGDFDATLQALFRADLGRRADGETMPDLLRAEAQWIEAELGRLLGALRPPNADTRFALRLSEHVLLTTGLPRDRHVADLLSALQVNPVTEGSLYQLRKRKHLSIDSAQRAFGEAIESLWNSHPLLLLLVEFQEDARYEAALDASPSTLNRAIARAFRNPAFTPEPEDIGTLQAQSRKLSWF